MPDKSEPKRDYQPNHLRILIIIQVMKRLRRAETGDVVKITLGKDVLTYAQALENPLFAFYDRESKTEMQIADIVRLPIAFEIYVVNSAVTSGRWTVVGNVRLSPELLVLPKFFIEDGLKRGSFRVKQGEREWHAVRDDCIGLERAAVWDAEHVEDRLRDHYAGRPNKWLESLRIR